MKLSLLFLHGVSVGAPSGDWREAMQTGLRNVGYGDEVRSISIVKPTYNDLLTNPNLAAKTLPNETPGSAEERHRKRASYEYAQASLRRLLDIDTAFEPARILVPTAVPNFAQHAPVLNQARDYVRDKHIRAHVLSRIIEKLPKEPVELVVLGHSLGSVVTVDLLAHLPAHVRVRRVVTIGSPLGLKALEGTRMPQTFPYDRIGSWLNAFAAGDPVSLGRGVAWRYPAALDHRVRFAYGPHDLLQKHNAANYLQDDDVARAIGEALFGNRDKTVAIPSTNSTQLVPNEIEASCLLVLAYGHLTLQRLEKEEPKIAPRYKTALQIVRLEIGDRLSQLADAERRPLHPNVEALTGHSAVQAPASWTNEVDVAVKTLTIVATTNLVQPFDIDDEGAQLEVLAQLAQGMGVGATMGVHVCDAVKAARKGLRPNRAWKYAGMAAAGLAIVALGPIGIAAGGAAGAVGAAAITSGLAAFGPGGMVGGIALTTLLASSGAAVTTSSIVAALSPEEVETALVRHMSHALARKRLAMPAVFDDWLAITALESELVERHARLDGISDDDSLELKGLGKKIASAQRALQWMNEHDLAPSRLAIEKA